MGGLISGSKFKYGVDLNLVLPNWGLHGRTSLSERPRESSRGGEGEGGQNPQQSIPKKNKPMGGRKHKKTSRGLGKQVFSACRVGGFKNLHGSDNHCAKNFRWDALLPGSAKFVRGLLNECIRYVDWWLTS